MFASNWSPPSDLEFADSLKKRGHDLQEMAWKSTPQMGDFRPVLRTMASMILTAGSRLFTLHGRALEAERDRDVWKRNHQIAQDRFVEAQRALDAMRKNYEILHIEVTDLRRLKAAPGSSESGPRVYFEE